MYIFLSILVLKRLQKITKINIKPLYPPVVVLAPQSLTSDFYSSSVVVTGRIVHPPTLLEAS